MATFDPALRERAAAMRAFIVKGENLLANAEDSESDAPQKHPLRFVILKIGQSANAYKIIHGRSLARGRERKQNLCSFSMAYRGA
jgi:hypothetical protein